MNHILVKHITHNTRRMIASPDLPSRVNNKEIFYRSTSCTNIYSLIFLYILNQTFRELCSNMTISFPIFQYLFRDIKHTI